MANTTINPTPQTLYPTRDSLNQVVEEATVSLPIIDRNHLLTVLMTYHNSLLRELGKYPEEPNP